MSFQAPLPLPLVEDYSMPSTSFQMPLLLLAGEWSSTSFQLRLALSLAED